MFVELVAHIGLDFLRLSRFCGNPEALSDSSQFIHIAIIVSEDPIAVAGGRARVVKLFIHVDCC